MFSLFNHYLYFKLVNIIISIIIIIIVIRPFTSQCRPVKAKGQLHLYSPE